MQNLNFGRKEYESIKKAASMLNKENGDPDRLYNDEIKTIHGNDEITFIQDAGWLCYQLQDRYPGEILYFEFNTTTYFGILKFIHNKVKDTFEINENEVSKEFNEEIKKKIEWLIQKFSKTDWTLDSSPAEEKDNKNGFRKTTPSAETENHFKSDGLKYDLKEFNTIKYTCPSCGANIQSEKPVKVICVECGVEFEEV